MVELGLDDTVGILRQPWVRPHRTSAGRGWSGAYVSTQAERPYRGAFDAARSHLLILHLGGPVDVVRGRGGAARRTTVPAGGFFVHPAGQELTVELGADLDTVHANLDAALLDEAADGRPVELQPHIGVHDPMLEQLVRSMDATLRDWQPSARTYADHLVTMLAAHLVHRYGAGRSRAGADERAAGGRSSRGSVSAVIDLMKQRLAEPIPLSELAGAAGLSTSQLTRQFKAATGTTPHRYLVRLRVEQAARELRAGDHSIARIAVDCGFSHQEHLTRTMRAQLGTTPAQVRRAG